MNFQSVIDQQYQELGRKYQGRYLVKQANGLWSVMSRFSFSVRYKGKQIDDDYDIEIQIPQNFPSTHPTVKETGNRISPDFHHSEEVLCLGEPSEVILKFQEEPTLLGFTERCIISFLYNFSCKEKDGSLPFGELSHGWLGILEHFQEILRIKNRKIVLDLIKICAENHYNGHVKCPSGSKRRLRRCHGETLLKVVCGAKQEKVV